MSYKYLAGPCLKCRVVLVDPAEVETPAGKQRSDGHYLSERYVYCPVCKCAAAWQPIESMSNV